MVDNREKMMIAAKSINFASNEPPMFYHIMATFAVVKVLYADLALFSRLDKLRHSVLHPPDTLLRTYRPTATEAIIKCHRNANLLQISVHLHEEINLSCVCRHCIFMFNIVQILENSCPNNFFAKKNSPDPIP